MPSYILAVGFVLAVVWMEVAGIEQVGDLQSAGPGQSGTDNSSLLRSSHEGHRAEDPSVLLERAVERGDTDAMVRLGRLYKYGLGVLPDDEEAEALIRAAANLGDPKGMLELGRLHRTGIGCERSLTMAYVWFSRAAAKGSHDARRERDELAEKMSTDQVLEAEKVLSSM